MKWLQTGFLLFLPVFLQTYHTGAVAQDSNRNVTHHTSSTPSTVDAGCSSANPCSEAEGPCGSSSDCVVGLICGYNNCPREDGVHQPGDDCCTKIRTMCAGWDTGTENCCSSTDECRENEGDCDEHQGCAPGFVCGTSNCDDSGSGDKFWPHDDCCTRVSCLGTENGCCKGQCLEGEGPCFNMTECEDGFDCQDVCEYGMCCTKPQVILQARILPPEVQIESEVTADSGCQKKAGKGADYTGPVNTTASGRDCMNWSLQSPHKHEFLHDDHNMCRNPSSKTSGKAVWCYTTNPETRWEYCPVPWCTELAREVTGNILANTEIEAGNQTKNNVTHETYYIIGGSVASALVLIGIIVLVSCILRSRRQNANTIEPDLNPVYGTYDCVDYTVAEVEDTNAYYAVSEDGSDQEERTVATDANSLYGN